MFGKKFLKFIEIWQNHFAIERTINEKKCISRDGKPLPWYTYPAIEYLSQFDYGDKNIFEFGCAFSSLFWAKRAQNVISIEDKQTWFEKWSKELKAKNLQICFRQEEQYENAILETGKKFDVIVIDGIRRAQCTKTALQALSSEGMIILDDSDRIKTSLEYETAVSLLKNAGLLQVDFYGFCPMNIYPKTTSIFFTRNFNFPTINEKQPACGIGSLWQLSRKKRKELYRLQNDE